MQQLVDKVRLHIFTSNDIIPRVSQPYFHNHPSVPKALTNFKLSLQEYRMETSKHLAILRQAPVHSSLPTLSDLSIGSFSHVFVGALTVSSFGIGDCAESSAKLVIEMLVKGYGDLAFIGIKFPAAKLGMEQTHQFIIANLPKIPSGLPQKASIYDLFKLLPRNAVIGDAFLGLAFTPDSVPNTFREYAAAYGETEIVQCFHFCNIGWNFLNHYLSLTKQITERVKLQQDLFYGKVYDLDSKMPIPETSIIALLNVKTTLVFFGVRDNEYKVDAIAEIKNKSDRISALEIQDVQQRYGRFFQNKQGKQMFVLEGINIFDHKPNIGEYIKQILSDHKIPHLLS